MQISDILTKITTQKLDAYIVGTSNLFLKQDILTEENMVQKLTGFKSDIGTLVVTKNQKTLLVNQRDELQAKLQAKGCEISTLSFISWLQENPDIVEIGYNPWNHSIDEISAICRHCPKVVMAEDKDADYADFLSAQIAQAFEHKLEFCGVGKDEKIAQITAFLREKNFDAMLFCAADCVSWLLNMRSNALPYTPVLRAYALVDKNSAVKVFAQNVNGIECLPFSKLAAELKNYQNIAVDIKETPQKIGSIIGRYKRTEDPIVHLKAIKNPIEIANIKQTHLDDGVALCKLLFWLENNYKGKTELDVSAKLLEFRKQRQNFFSNSFETIAAFGKNAAVVHYMPTLETNTPLADGTLLLDSGGQYYSGTTDVTRTVALGKAEDEVKQSFTQVLKAHINLAKTQFPQGISGIKLDTLARAVMWQKGLNYQHGTGHGVGFFGKIHEGPQSLSLNSSSAPLEAGMVLSIEPGYYKENFYGIRIENLVLVEPSNTADMLKFVPLTLAPVDKRLIDVYLLTTEEKEWLNEYHQNVFAQIAPHLQEDERAWLELACAAV